MKRSLEEKPFSDFFFENINAPDEKRIKVAHNSSSPTLIPSSTSTSTSNSYPRTDIPNQVNTWAKIFNDKNQKPLEFQSNFQAKIWIMKQGKYFLHSDVYYCLAHEECSKCYKIECNDTNPCFHIFESGQHSENLIPTNNPILSEKLQTEYDKAIQMKIPPGEIIAYLKSKLLTDIEASKELKLKFGNQGLREIFIQTYRDKLANAGKKREIPSSFKTITPTPTSTPIPTLSVSETSTQSQSSSSRNKIIPSDKSNTQVLPSSSSSSSSSKVPSNRTIRDSMFATINQSLEWKDTLDYNRKIPMVFDRYMKCEQSIKKFFQYIVNDHVFLCTFHINCLKQYRIVTKHNNCFLLQERGIHTDNKAIKCPDSIPQSLHEPIINAFQQNISLYRLISWLQTQLESRELGELSPMICNEGRKIIFLEKAQQLYQTYLQEHHEITPNSTNNNNNNKINNINNIKKTIVPSVDPKPLHTMKNTKISFVSTINPSRSISPITPVKSPKDNNNNSLSPAIEEILTIPSFKNLLFNDINHNVEWKHVFNPKGNADMIVKNPYRCDEYVNRYFRYLCHGENYLCLSHFECKHQYRRVDLRPNANGFRIEERGTHSIEKANKQLEKFPLYLEKDILRLLTRDIPYYQLISSLKEEYTQHNERDNLYDLNDLTCNHARRVLFFDNIQSSCRHFFGHRMKPSQSSTNTSAGVQQHTPLPPQSSFTSLSRQSSSSSTNNNLASVQQKNFSISPIIPEISDKSERSVSPSVSMDSFNPKDSITPDQDLNKNQSFDSLDQNENKANEINTISDFHENNDNIENKNEDNETNEINTPIEANENIELNGKNDKNDEIEHEHKENDNVSNEIDISTPIIDSDSVSSLNQSPMSLTTENNLEDDLKNPSPSPNDIIQSNQDLIIKKEPINVFSNSQNSFILDLNELDTDSVNNPTELTTQPNEALEDTNKTNKNIGNHMEIVLQYDSDSDESLQSLSDDEFTEHFEVRTSQSSEIPITTTSTTTLPQLNQITSQSTEINQNSSSFSNETSETNQMSENNDTNITEKIISPENSQTIQLTIPIEAINSQPTKDLNENNLSSPNSSNHGKFKLRKTFRIFINEGINAYLTHLPTHEQIIQIIESQFATDQHAMQFIEKIKIDESIRYRFFSILDRRAYALHSKLKLQQANLPQTNLPNQNIPQPHTPQINLPHSTLSQPTSIQSFQPGRNYSLVDNSSLLQSQSQPQTFKTILPFCFPTISDATQWICTNSNGKFVFLPKTNCYQCIKHYDCLLEYKILLASSVFLIEQTNHHSTKLAPLIIEEIPTVFLEIIDYYLVHENKSSSGAYNALFDYFANNIPILHILRDLTCNQGLKNMFLTKIQNRRLFLLEKQQQRINYINQSLSGTSFHTNPMTNSLDYSTSSASQPERNSDLMNTQSYPAVTDNNYSNNNYNNSIASIQSQYINLPRQEELQFNGSNNVMVPQRISSSSTSEINPPSIPYQLNGSNEMIQPTQPTQSTQQTTSNQNMPTNQPISNTNPTNTQNISVANQQSSSDESLSTNKETSQSPNSNQKKYFLCQQFPSLTEVQTWIRSQGNYFGLHYQCYCLSHIECSHEFLVKENEKNEFFIYEKGFHAKEVVPIPNAKYEFSQLLTNEILILLRNLGNDEEDINNLIENVFEFLKDKKELQEEFKIFTSNKGLRELFLMKAKIFYQKESQTPKPVLQQVKQAEKKDIDDSDSDSDSDLESIEEPKRPQAIIDLTGSDDET